MSDEGGKGGQLAGWDGDETSGFQAGHWQGLGLSVILRTSRQCNARPAAKASQRTSRAHGLQRRLADLVMVHLPTNTHWLLILEAPKLEAPRAAAPETSSSSCRAFSYLVFVCLRPARIFVPGLARLTGSIDDPSRPRPSANCTAALVSALTVDCWADCFGSPGCQSRDEHPRSKSRHPSPRLQAL